LVAVAVLAPDSSFLPITSRQNYHQAAILIWYQDSNQDHLLVGNRSAPKVSSH